MMGYVKNSRRPLYVLVLCTCLLIPSAACLLTVQCEAALSYLENEEDTVLPKTIVPALKTACIDMEGSLHAPVFVQAGHGSGLSLDKMEVSFTLPSLSSPWGHIIATGMTAGRQRIQWGPGSTGGLILSDQASLDGLTLHFGLNKVSYTQLYAARELLSGKWLLAHRLEGQILPTIRLGISEAIAVSEGFKMRFAHLAPLVPRYLIQHLTMRSDRAQDISTNAFFSVDASINLTDNLLAYAELMADDFPWARSVKGRVPYMVGSLVGVSFTKPLNLGDTRQTRSSSVTAEYVRINNYVYSHKNPDNTYVTRTGQLIGHPLGPDADGAYIILATDSYPETGFESGNHVALLMGYERHGEGELGQPWHRSHGTEREFLWGVVETRKVLGLSASITKSPVELELSLRAESLDNAGHVPGARAIEGGIAITARLCYSHPISNL